MNKLVSNNYCQCQAQPACAEELVFALSCWSLDQGKGKGQILPSLSLCLCVMHFTAICLFLASMAGRKKKRKVCLKQDPSQVFSISSFIGNKKSKTSWVCTEKRSRNISSSTPSFVCNGVLKPYFMSLLTYICCALNNMNYVLRYKLLIPLDFLLWHFNPGIL